MIPWSSKVRWGVGGGGMQFLCAEAKLCMHRSCCLEAASSKKHS